MSALTERGSRSYAYAQIMSYNLHIPAVRTCHNCRMENVFTTVGDWVRDMSKGIREGYAKQDAALAQQVEGTFVEGLTIGAVEGLVTGTIIAIPVVAGIGLLGAAVKRHHENEAAKIWAETSRSGTSGEIVR